MKIPSVLVIDDEPDLLALIELTLTKLGLSVVASLTVADAKSLIASRTFDLCLTDMRLKDGTGLDVLNEIAQRALDLPTAVLTAHGNAENAVAALKAGAFDYLAKPVSIDQLRALVKSALAIPRTKSEAASNGIARAIDSAPSTTTAESQAPKRFLLGQSAPMVRLRELLGRLALSKAPVHIQGESGTGKELAARILHEAGPRNTGPFIAVNCGAIPEMLMEAEFFGAKKGAYTGSTEDRLGFFQAADGGTLFLDEVADLPLSMQVKLLRAIQERSVRRVGTTTEDPVDIRLVSATHKKLPELVASGSFRQDLFYRLSVIPVTMPSLREVRTDIAEIARALLARLARHETPMQLSQKAEAALAQYDFPGNVRELENMLERAVALATTPGIIDAADLQLFPPEIDDETMVTTTAVPTLVADSISPILNSNDRQGRPLQEYLDSVEKQALIDALAQSNGNRTQAARVLGITFRSMRYRLERFGMERAD